MKVSIIVPTYNNLSFLKFFISSIKKNSKYNHQIILHINDGSDGTLEFAKKEEISFTYSSKNIGLCSSLNKASSLVNTNYILYAHDDMFFCKNWDVYLENEVKKFPDNLYYLTGTNVSANNGLINFDCGSSPENFNEMKFNEFCENDISKEAIIEANRKIKIHDLLRHTSGFTYGIFGDSYAKRRLRNSVLGKRPLPVTMTSNDFVKELSKYPLAYNPGESWEYGRSTDVLGRVIEIASKVSLETYLNENIFSTLNMKDTGFYVKRKNFSRIAEPFKEKEPNLIDITKKPLFFKGGHGLVSTVSDYLNFCHMLLNGGKFEDKQVLSKKTVEYMTANHLDNKISRSTSRIPGNGYGFGLGFAVREHDGVSTWPGSKGDFYWLGYGGTYFWIDPKEELIAISMTQSVNNRDKINRLMRNLVYQSINK